MDLYRIQNLSELKELLDLLRHHDVGEFEIEAEGRKLRVSRGRVVEPTLNLSASPGAILAPTPAVPEAGPGASAPPSPAPATAAREESLPAGMRAVRSPMVGTFYRSPSPEADPFIQVGDRVEEETVICIIEAMKVMNEIPAGVAGVVQEILVQNGEPVEYSQPILHIRTD